MTVIIDADAHVMEAPDIFTSRFPARMANDVPHVRFVPEKGTDMWFIGDRPLHGAAISVICGDAGDPIERRAVDPEAGGWAHLPKTVAEVHPSSYDPNERAKVMDQFGIQSATTFPNLGVLSPDVYRSNGASLDLQMKIVAAHNDWIMTWPQEQPGRFIPLACVPYWDIDGAIAEIERAADIGMKGLVMSGKPQLHGCPVLADAHWDPMWAAAQAANMSISFHAGAGGFEVHHNPAMQRAMGNEVLQVYTTVAFLFENAIAAIDLLSSGVLQRFPRLNFAIVETGMGWAPFALEALDHHYQRFQPWRTRPEMRADELPSDVFKRQMFVNVWFEQVTDEIREGGLLGNVMFETDYPHPTCLLADDIRGVLANQLGRLSSEELDDVLYKNTMRCYHLTPDDIGLSSTAA